MSEFDRRDDAARGRTDDESLSKLAARLAKKISDGSLDPPELLSFSKQKQDQPLPVLFGTRDFVEPPIAFIGDGKFFTHKRTAVTRPTFHIAGGTAPVGSRVGYGVVSGDRNNIGNPKEDERFIHYYYTMLLILCHGVIDYVPTIRFNDNLSFVNPFIPYNDFRNAENSFRDIRYSGYHVPNAGMGHSQVHHILSERLFKSPHPNTLDGVGGSVRIMSGRDYDINSSYLENFIREAYAQDTYAGLEVPSTRTPFVPKFEGVSTVMFPKFWWGIGSNVKKVTVRAQRIYSRQTGQSTNLGWYPEKAGIRITSNITEEIQAFTPGFNDIHRLEKPTLFIPLTDTNPFGYYSDWAQSTTTPPSIQLNSAQTRSMVAQISAFWDGLTEELGDYMLQNSRFTNHPPALIRGIEYHSGRFTTGDITNSSFQNANYFLRRSNYLTFPTRAETDFSGVHGVIYKIAQACNSFAISPEVFKWWGGRLPSSKKDRIRCVVYWLPATRLNGNLQFNIGSGLTSGDTIIDTFSARRNRIAASTLLSNWHVHTRLVIGPTHLNLAPRVTRRLHGVFTQAISGNQIMISGQTSGTPVVSQYTELGEREDMALTAANKFKVYQNNDIFLINSAGDIPAAALFRIMKVLGKLVFKQTSKYYRSTSKIDSNIMFKPADIASFPRTVRKTDIRYYNMNPAHAIRDVKTSTKYGQGVYRFELDEFSFRAAADTYHREGMGISIIWDKQSTADEFIKLINKHTNSVTFTDHTTGKYKLFPIREGGLAYSPILSPDNVVSIDKFVQPTFDDLVTSVRVSYWEIGSRQTVSFTVHDETALRAQNNTFKLSKIKYPAFIDQTTVVKAAYRDLRALSRPLISCELKVFYFAAADFHIGKLFRLTWPDYGLLTLPMRVTSINFGDAKVNFITINAVQDGYEEAPPTTFIIDSEDASGEAEPVFPVTPPVIDLGPTFPTDAPEPEPDPDTPIYPPPAFPNQPGPFEFPEEDPNNPGLPYPAPAFYYSVEEAPYYRVVETRGQSVVDADLAANPYDMYIQAMSEEPPSFNIDPTFIQAVGVDLYSRVDDGP